MDEARVLIEVLAYLKRGNVEKAIKNINYLLDQMPESKKTQSTVKIFEDFRTKRMKDKYRLN